MNRYLINTKQNSGFTLLELLVTISVIGILTAIAIPQYQQYRQRGFDTRASSDLRNVALAEEAYFLDWEAYYSCLNSTCTNLPGINVISKGVTIAVNSTATGFTATASHNLGTGKVFAWDSSLGGMQ